jgi:hypothetical protein
MENRKKASSKLILPHVKINGPPLCVTGLDAASGRCYNGFKRIFRGENGGEE